jgi:hypothetical protein
MESESRFLQNDGLLKLVVVVVNSVLAELAPRKAGRFRALRSEKNQQTNMDTINCETHRVDIRNKSIGGNGWKVCPFHTILKGKELQAGCKQFIPPLLLLTWLQSPMVSILQ